MCDKVTYKNLIDSRPLFRNTKVITRKFLIDILSTKYLNPFYTSEKCPFYSDSILIKSL